MIRELPSFTVYQSSAGSGKTFTLAREYLVTILNEENSFKNVLAVTFTNKAAAEMKERILSYLVIFAGYAPPARGSEEMAVMLMQETGFSPEKLKKRAGQVLFNILHDYSDFNIGTIDSFIHRIIRSFTYELNLTFDFDVTLDNNDFIELVVDQLLSLTGDDQALTGLLLEFSRMQLEEGRTWRVDSFLKEYAGFLTGEDSIEPVKKIMQANPDFTGFSKVNSARLVSIETEARELCLEADALIRESGLEMEYFNFKSTGIYGFFEKIASKLSFEKLLLEEGALRAAKVLEGGEDIYGKNTPDELVHAFESLQRQITELYNNKIRPRAQNLREEYELRLLLRESIFRMALSRKISEAMQVVKQNENILPIFEFNRLIYNITRTQEVPFIYEHTGERFYHYLIDEFQDTSALQWFNMLPLIEESIARGGYNLIVGDAKQAIYRFRNGDVEQFIDLPSVKGAQDNAVLKAREAALERVHREENLSANFRSAGEVITFNNSFFDWVKDSLGGITSKVYAGQRQEQGRALNDGFVSVTLYPGDDLSRDEINQFHLDKIKQRIGECRADGYAMRDICILVRTKNEASEVATFLIEDFSVVSDESLLLKQNAVFRLLSAFLKLLRNRKDKVSAVAVTTWLYHSGHISQERYIAELSALNTYGSSIVADPVFRSLQERFPTFSLEELEPKPLYEQCEKLISDLELAKEGTLATRYFLDLVSSYRKQRPDDIPGFSSWLDEQMESDSIPLSESDDAIRILTIHKAKGLEFPVVIYPFAWEKDTPPHGKREYTWVDNPDPNRYSGLPVFYLPLAKSLQHTVFAGILDHEKELRLLDMVNLVYVAFTRARNRLFVISSPPSQKGTANLYDLLAGYLNFSGCEPRDYDFGERSEKEDNNGEKKFGKFIQSRWTYSPGEGRISLKNRLSPATGEVSEALDRGNLMHKILSEIRYTKDIDSVLQRYVSRGWIGPEEMKEMECSIREVLSLAKIAPLFDATAHIKTEPGIIAGDGNLFRPDRVVVKGDEAWVLDYKTGQSASWHDKQVKRYMDLLVEMGYGNVRGLLLYIDSSQVREIS